MSVHCAAPFILLLLFPPPPQQKHLDGRLKNNDKRMHFGRRTEFSRWGNCCNNERRDKHNNILKSGFNRATLREKTKNTIQKVPELQCEVQSHLVFSPEVRCCCSSVLLPLLFHFLSARVAVQMQGHGNHCTALPPRLIRPPHPPPPASHIFLFALFNYRFYSRANNVSRIHSLIAQLIIIIHFSFTDL